MPFHLEALPTVFRVIHIELPEKTISGKIAVLIDQRKRSATGCPRKFWTTKNNIPKLEKVR